MLKKMLIKTLAVYILLIAAVLYFQIDLSALTERTVDFVLQREEEQPLPAGTLTPSTLTESGRTVNIGDTVGTVMQFFGEATDTFPSEYGFLWYAFHQDYKHYIQIGMKEQKGVCAVYTNSPSFEFNGLHVGSTMDEVRMTLGDPLESIQKGNIIFQLNCGTDGKRETDVFLFRDLFVQLFYDCFKNNTVTAIHIIEEDTEREFVRQYAQGSPDLAQSMQKENFYVTNALRVREGKEPVLWSDRAYTSAVAHSRDMAENNYFSHTDLGGGSVADRIRSTGLKVSAVAENLAAGGQNGIIMHELLMNSEGHRRNILGHYQYLGVGVAFNEENRPYLTQNYYNPRQLPPLP